MEETLQKLRRRGEGLKQVITPHIPTCLWSHKLWIYVRVPLFLLQPVSTDFGQYNSYGDVSGGVRGKAEEPFYVPLR